MTVVVAILSNFQTIFGVGTYECALAEKSGTKRAILTKIGKNSI